MTGDFKVGEGKDQNIIGPHGIGTKVIWREISSRLQAIENNGNKHLA